MNARSKTTNRTPICGGLDEALVHWIADCAAKNHSISDLLFKEKEKRLLAVENYTKADGDTIKLVFFNGWLEKFKKRYGLCQIIYHGEQASTDVVNAMD